MSREDNRRRYIIQHDLITVSYLLVLLQTHLQSVFILLFTEHIIFLKLETIKLLEVKK